jgi:hypothetical protein
MGRPILILSAGLTCAENARGTVMDGTKNGSAIITAEHIAAARRAGGFEEDLAWAVAAPRTFADVWSERINLAIFSWSVPSWRDGIAASAPADVRIIRDGHAMVEDGYCFCDGTAIVDARGSAKVIAHGSAVVDASDTAIVVARGESSVYACGHAHASASGVVRVVASDLSSVVAFDYAIVDASGWASVAAYGNAIVRRDGDDSVILSVLDNAGGL